MHKEKPIAPEAREHVINAERILGDLRKRLESPITITAIANALDTAALELQSARRGLAVHPYRPRRRAVLEPRS